MESVRVTSSRFLLGFSYVWLGGVLLLSILNVIGIAASAPDVPSAYERVTSLLSPFNVGYYLVTVALLLPGIGARALSARLRPPGDRRQRLAPLLDEARMSRKPGSMQLVLRIPAAAAVVLGLAGSAAVLGRTFLPEITLPGTTPTATPVNYRARMEPARHDFEAAAATILGATTGQQAENSYRAALARGALGIPDQLQRIRGRIVELPEGGREGSARRSYLIAADLLERASKVTLPYFQSSEVRDLLNRATASWRRGDDLLK